jgi:hypothetical protein
VLVDDVGDGSPLRDSQHRADEIPNEATGFLRDFLGVVVLPRDEYSFGQVGHEQLDEELTVIVKPIADELVPDVLGLFADDGLNSGPDECEDGWRDGEILG